MIKRELANVYIASDGKRFLDKDKAEKHEAKIQEDINQIDRFEEVIKNWS
tara:strand:- start:1273 stop:1422 length:150 start_codon:yes stop_codon:yes gene_type:complete